MSGAWRHQRISLPWGRLSVQVTGEGPPLLLLHGLGGSGRYWAGLGPLLAETRTLIAPDLAGFGRSDKPDVDYGRDLHVASLEGLLDALRADGAVDVAGHSMGGILGALLAARAPERVLSLALVASPFPRQQMHPHRMPTRGVRAGLYWTVQHTLPLVAPLVRSETFPAAVVADYLRHTVASYERTSNSLIWDPTLGAEFAGLAAALRGRRQLLMYSDEDRTIGPDNLDRWRAVLPDAEVQRVAGAHQLLLRDHFASLARWEAAADRDRLAGISSPA